MANYASAKKRIRQTVKRTEVNRARLSTIRSALRKVEEAIASGDEPAAREAFKVAEPLVARGAQKGVMPRNTAARRISRLSNRIKALAA
jgi:small subunit ribosomal protein S20